MNRKKSLIKTNPYLKDPKKREKLILRSVLTSSAVEGIHISPNAPIMRKSSKENIKKK